MLIDLFFLLLLLIKCVKVENTEVCLIKIMISVSDAQNKFVHGVM